MQSLYLTQSGVLTHTVTNNVNYEFNNYTVVFQRFKPILRFCQKKRILAICKKKGSDRYCK